MSVWRLSTVLFMVLLALVLGQPVPAASPPQPTYGGATVDGNPGEWNSADFFANMYRAGNSSKPLESKVYLRYDCGTHTMYVLVSAQSGVSVLASGWESAAWAAINSISNKVYSGNSGNDNSPPDFQWVGLSGDGQTAQGYEASFKLDPGTYKLLVGAEVLDGGTSQGSATLGSPLQGIDLQIVCGSNGHPAITVEKYVSVDEGMTYQTADFIPGPAAATGHNVYFRYVVANAGNVPLSNIALTDDVYDLSSYSKPATLAVGASFTLDTGPYPAVHGQQKDTATATGDYGGTTYRHTNDAYYLGVTPKLDLTKYVSVNDGVTWKDANTPAGPHVLVGKDVCFRFVVVNSGDVQLNNITLVDNKYDLGGCTIPASLAAGAWFECLLDPVSAQPGQQTNTATATGDYGGQTCSESNDANYFGDHPCLDIIKTYAWTAGDGTKPGDVVTITFTASNKGNITLTNLAVADDKFGTISMDKSTLAPGESATGTRMLTLTQTLLDVGSHTDTATASAKATIVADQGSSTIVDVGDSTTQVIPFTQSPSIDIIKTFAWVSGDGSKPGNVVRFTFTAINNGNVTLNSVTVTDDKLGSVTLSKTTLLPGETATGTKDLTLTQGLLDAGSHTNIANATGTPVVGSSVSDTASQKVTFITSPSVDILKTFAWTTGDGTEIGHVVTFTFKVTNNGNVTLHGIVVNDDKFGAIGGIPTTMAPGATATATRTLGITQELLDIGYHTNIVTVTGTPPIGPNVTDSDTQTVTFGAEPSIDVLKTYAWTKGDGSQVGDQVTFTFKVTNTGNVPLTNVSAVDDKLGAITGIPSTLAPGQSVTGNTKVLTITQALLDAGSHTNTVAVTGKPPVGDAVTDTATQTVDLITVVSIDVIKRFAWTTGDGSKVGDVVTFTFTVTNTGNVTLNPITAHDDKLGDITLSPTRLAPGGVATGTKSLTVNQALLDAGMHENTVTVTGKPLIGANATDTASQKVCLMQRPEIDLVKCVSVDGGVKWEDANVAPGPYVLVDKPVKWRYVITNKGNVTLTSVALSDSDIGQITLPPDGLTLTPGTDTIPPETVTVYADGNAVKDQYTNLATASGTAPSGSRVHDDDPASYFGADPQIGIEKSVGKTDDPDGIWDDADSPKGLIVRVGDNVYFKYVITNDGNVPLTHIRLTDNVFGPPGFDPGNIPDLQPGQPPFVYIYGPVKAEIGQHTNTGTAEGTPPVGPDKTASDDANYWGGNPDIDVEKYVGTTPDGPWDDADSPTGPIIPEDDPIYFKYVITNTGNVLLTGITLTDNRYGPPDFNPYPIPDLKPGESYTYVYGSTPALSDQQTNTATVTGQSVVGSADDTDDANYFGQDPGIDVEKSVGLTNDPDGVWDDADTEAFELPRGYQPGIYFKYVITNESNVTLTDITLDDDTYGPGSKPTFNPYPIPDLEPDESFTYIYGPVRPECGTHTNLATARGTPPVGLPVEGKDTATYHADCPPNSLYQAYPGDSNGSDRAQGGYRGSLNDVITAVPGLLVIVPQDDGEPSWAHYVPAFQDKVGYTLKNVVLQKQTPTIIQCADVFPMHTVRQQGTPNIRLRWPLMYEIPGTVWTLTLQYGTSVPYDDDAAGPHLPGFYHSETWTWEVDVTLESMQYLLALFHETPFGRDEVPLFSDEVLYPVLQAKLQGIINAMNPDHPDTVTAGLLLGEFEMEVMDACIAASPAIPKPTGPGTGIAETLENPACCKLLVDSEHIGFEMGMLQPSK